MSDDKPTPPAGSARVRRIVPADDAHPQSKTGPRYVSADNLNDEETRGLALYRKNERGEVHIFFNAGTTLYPSRRKATLYKVVRAERNRRGEFMIEYSCDCPYGMKHARRDCRHIYAEKLRLGEVVVTGQISQDNIDIVVAKRRPARRRIAENGMSVRSAQRAARGHMSERIPQLIKSLADRYARDLPKKTVSRRKRGGQLTEPYLQAAALIYKAACGLSSEAMRYNFAQAIDVGHLALARCPHPNTLSRWINDKRLTSCLSAMLELTSEPFRDREEACIADATAVSESRLNSYRLVKYGDDVRPQAKWTKMHALIGVETMVIMSVVLTTQNSHDVNHLLELVRRARKTFDLRYLLADKGYLADHVIGQLREWDIRPCIPVKKRWDPSTKDSSAAAEELVAWYEAPGGIFHEVYRFRVKIEGFFSILKRLTGGNVITRGRPRRESAEASEPRIATINELLARSILMNLRATVLLEEETAMTIDYLIPERCFPRSTQPIIKTEAA